jgi:hypothetical protein
MLKFSPCFYFNLIHNMNDYTKFSLAFLVLMPIILYSQTDQELVWGSYFGGNENDGVRNIIFRNDGGFYISGDTGSNGGISTQEVYQQTYGGGILDVYFASFDENKQLMWATYFGGESEDSFSDLVQLSDGKLILAGSTSSTNAISSPGAFIGEIPGSNSGFISCFSNEGDILWSTYLGGSNWVNFLWCAKSDLNDHIIVAGVTDSQDFPTTAGAHQTEIAGGSDGYLSKFDSNGNLIWSTFVGGENNDQILSITLTNQGDIVALGRTNSSTGIATEGSHQTIYGGGNDLFLMKFSSDGQLIWSTYFGGEEEENAAPLRTVIVDEDSNIYFSGTSSSSSGISTLNAHQSDLLGSWEPNRNIILCKFSSTGEQIWGTYFGSHLINTARTLIIHQEYLLLSAHAYTDDISLGNPLQEQTNSPSEGNAFFAAFTLDQGIPLWGTFYGGSLTTPPLDIKSINANQIALVGATQSFDNIATIDGHQTAMNGISDGFIAFFQINYGTGVNENEVLPMSVFPNPSSGAVRLQLPASFAFMADVEVHDLTGKLMLSKKDFNAFDLLYLPQKAGMYIITCHNDKAVTRTKVIVE